jgi:dihydrofolate reductase
MGSVVAGLFISLDGVVESPDQWQFDFDEVMGEAVNQQVFGNQAVLLGRVTYEMWAPYWPTITEGEDTDFADYINNVPKYVVSTTLDNVDEWQNSTLVKESLRDFVTEFKKTGDGTMAVAGSPSVVRSLVEEDLLDRLYLMIHPVVAGSGLKRLFDTDASLKKLRLVEAKPTPTGCIVTTYEPAA